jgi:hypothetical protein
VIQFILKVLFVVLLVRLFSSLFGLFRGPRTRKRSFSPKSDQDRVKNPDYSNLSPYDIEDAEYEEIPKEKR